MILEVRLVTPSVYVTPTGALYKVNGDDCGLDLESPKRIAETSGKRHSVRSRSRAWRTIANWNGARMVFIAPERIRSRVLW